MNRSVIADASKVSGSDFLRALQGKPPRTEAEMAERRRRAEAYYAARRAEFEEATRLNRERAAEIIADIRAKREALTEVHGDPLLRAHCFERRVG